MVEKRDSKQGLIEGTLYRIDSWALVKYFNSQVWSCPETF